MTRLPLPRFDTRRRKDLRDELFDRARVWLPEWRRTEGGDFGSAILEIAARLSAEVTERLDRVPEKAFRGFLDWLGVRGQAGRAGRLPVVFTMAAGSVPVGADAPVQFQALDVDPPVTFETDQSLTLVPGALASIVAADPARDAFYRPPAGFSALEAPRAVPSRWRVKADAPVGATQIQLEPELGLEDLPTIVHDKSGQHHRVVAIDAGIVTLDPPVGQVELNGSAPPLPMPMAGGDEVTRLSSFAPFDDRERNRQEHALYIGSDTVLNVKAPARIGIEGGTSIPTETDWFYWGKRVPQEPADWRRLSRAPGDALILTKPAGQLELLEIDGKKSRWLRGTTAPSAALTRIDLPQLTLTVNCDTGSPRTCASTDPPSTVAIEAVANTTPVVLDVPFYPLGREPRLFDAFYLASPEAFSKKNAFVEICVQLADGTTEGYSAARLGRTAADPLMLFGVGKDGNLHRLRPEPDPARPVRRLVPVRPPFSENGTTLIPAPSSPLNQKGQARLTTVSRQSDAVVNDALVAVTSKLDAWIWLQSAAPTGSRWYRAGTVFDLADGTPPSPAADEPPRVTLMRDSDGLRLAGIYKGTAYEARLAKGWETATVPQWTRVTPKPADGAAPSEAWEQVAPIFSLDQRLEGADAANGWLAADAKGLAIYRSNKIVRLPEVGEVSTAVTPLGIQLDANRLLVVVQQSGSPGKPARSSGPDDLQVVAWILTGTKAEDTEAEKLALDAGLEVVESFDWQLSATGDPGIVFCGRNEDGERVLATWRPLSGRGAKPHGIPSSRSDTIDVLHGAPGVLDGTIVTSGPHAEIVVVGFHPERAQNIVLPLSALENAWLIPGTGTPFREGDILVLAEGTKRITMRASDPPEASVGDFFFVHEFPSSVKQTKVEIFTPDQEQTIGFKGKIRAAGMELVLDDQDELVADDRPLVVEDSRKITQTRIDKGPDDDEEEERGAAQRVATLQLPAGARGTATYTYLIESPSRQIANHPALRLDELTDDQKAAMRDATLRFDDAAPLQKVIRFHPPGAVPRFAVLQHQWTVRPSGNPLRFAIENVYDAAQILSEPRSVNPELSWEYWDGTAWWTIKGLVDGTGNFLFSGKVAFCVPASLEPTDVVGRTSHWIRARLVGGDYGRESVAITSFPVPNTDPPETRQIMDRSLDEIVAPQIVSVNLFYSVCCAALPDYVLTKDGGAIRDQSNANRTREASLEVFVPLAQTVARAGGALPPSEAANGTSPEQPPTRALYLGFDEEITGEPISILFLIDSRDHDAAFPLEVDVLRGHRFEPVSLSDDGTRGLNETGVLTLRLSTPPQRASLFGDSRHWIRVRPNRRSEPGKWNPAIRAAYLNATWARASETQSNEVLGSSDGSPKQRVFLARPPILDNSLKLRVREPIGDEEITELRRFDSGRVLDELNRRPGRWVLWDEVVDPADHGPGERVYALDDETGAITFGDAAHGKIPPPGQDAIVAEQYKRGGGAAANAVTAWSQINLITPLQGVESVAAPEGAGGGTDPQDADAVVRFAPANLHSRNRALTLRDLENLGMQFSPDVAQVRAVARRSSVDLIVVMRGRNPEPPRAVQREILPYLLNLAPPVLADKDAIVIKGPRLITVRLSLHLEITAVERSGAVAREVAQRLTALLDPAAGGLDGTGWRLGDRIGEQEIAAVLDRVPNLETILNVGIAEQKADGSVAPLPAQLRPGDLLHLGSDSIQLEFALPATEATI